jgi:hypothetical protein
MRRMSRLAGLVAALALPVGVLAQAFPAKLIALLAYARPHPGQVSGR